MGFGAWLRRVRTLLRLELRERDLRLLLALVVVVALFWGFAELSEFAGDRELGLVDRAVLLAFRADPQGVHPIGPAWLTTAIVEISALGGGTVATMVTAAAFGFLVLAGKPRTAILLLAVAVGTFVGIYLLKDLFARARPELVTPLVATGGLAFPSGHASISAALYPTLGILIAQTLRQRRLRVYVVGLATLLALLIGCSRVFIGVHYPTDVLAGWSLGFAWALLCGVVEGALQRTKRLEPANPPGEATPEALRRASS